MPKEIKVAETFEIQEGQGKCVEVEGKRIAVFNSGGKYYAIEDTCTHVGGPLSEGDLMGTEVSCPWHGGKFDITTGKVLGGPPTRDVQCYKINVEGNALKLEI